VLPRSGHTAKASAAPALCRLTEVEQKSQTPASNGGGASNSKERLTGNREYLLTGTRVGRCPWRQRGALARSLEACKAVSAQPVNSTQVTSFGGR
jgi:hypothetical protein